MFVEFRHLNPVLPIPNSVPELKKLNSIEIGKGKKASISRIQSKLQSDRANAARARYISDSNVYTFSLLLWLSGLFQSLTRLNLELIDFGDRCHRCCCTDYFEFKRRQTIRRRNATTDVVEWRAAVKEREGISNHTRLSCVSYVTNQTDFIAFSSIFANKRWTDFSRLSFFTASNIFLYLYFSSILRTEGMFHY